jgi:CBS domain-containing protein
MKSTKISDYMVTNVVSVEPDTDLFQAIGLILKHKIDGMPVIDQKGRVVGILTQWNCLKLILSGSYTDEIGGLVQDVMEKDVHTISPHDDVVDVAAVMNREGWKQAFPVVERGKLVGTISCRDILEVIYDFDTHKAA